MPTKSNVDIFDSFEESHFADWLDELKEVGLIKSWERDVKPYELTTGLTHYWTETKTLKTKTKIETKQKVILKPSFYTPDFIIHWASEADGILCQTLSTKLKITTPFIAHYNFSSLYSVVEIKPDFDRNNMTRLFINNQKFVWEKYHEYVNLIHVNELFEETFTPTRYLLTPTGKERKIKWVVNTVNQFYANKTL